MPDLGLGMYRFDDPTYPKIKVGKFTVCRQDDGSVWIQSDDGEGAQFQNELFEKAISDFFAAYF